MTDKIILTSIGVDELKSIIGDSISAELKRQLPFTDLKGHSERLLGRKETAKLLNVSTSSLLIYVKQGRIKAHKIGRRVLFKQSDIDAAVKGIVIQPFNLDRDA